jgi:hypothetical protein
MSGLLFLKQIKCKKLIFVIAMTSTAWQSSSILKLTSFFTIIKSLILSMKRVLIVSGRSGSGKSSALNILEDLGYYCIDNLPLSLLPSLIKHFQQQSQSPDWCGC